MRLVGLKMSTCTLAGIITLIVSLVGAILITVKVVSWLLRDVTGRRTRDS